MITRLEAKNCIMTLIEKLQKILPVSSGQIYKYEYITGEEVLPPNQSKMIEQVTFTYSRLGKALEKRF